MDASSHALANVADSNESQGKVKEAIERHVARVQFDCHRFCGYNEH